MAKLIFGMMQSLDGYIGGASGEMTVPPPGVDLHSHFNDRVRDFSGMLYGRKIYEIMRYWDEAAPDWEAVEHEFASVWRPKPKWVVSRTLKSAGPNATIVSDDVEAFVRHLKETVDGDIDVAGPEFAGFLTGLGLIDEYDLYFRPFVLGGGKPFFAGARPPLRLIASDEIGENTVRLKYVPA